MNVGDEVLIFTAYGRRHEKAVVTRTTKTRFMVKDHNGRTLSFMTATGREVGSSGYGALARPWDEGSHQHLLDEHEARDLRQWIWNADISRVPLAALRTLKGILHMEIIKSS